MIKIAVAGTSAFGLPSFEALRTRTDVVLVGAISQPAKPVGRRQVVTPSPVSRWAYEHQRPILTPINWRDEAALARLKSWEIDLLIVAAYGLIVPPAVLSLPKLGCVNIHASLLPAHRGASPIAASILAGDTTSGITFMQMDQGMDTGPILKAWSLQVLPTDTTPTLSERLARLAAEHCGDIVSAYVNEELIPKPQPTGATYTKKITREDGRMSWESAQQLERKIRAYTPWPGLWTTWHGQTMKILGGTFLPQKTSEPTGLIVKTPNAWGVVCGDGAFLPTEIQFEGKRPQPADRIPGSYPNFIGSRFDY